MPERLSRFPTTSPELSRVQDDHIRVLNPVLGKDALQDDEPWRYVGQQGEPAFQNSWTNYDETYWRGARFLKDRFGWVTIEGLIRSGTTGALTPAFTLPDAYRPLYALTWPLITAAGIGRVTVSSEGYVSIVVGSTTWTSLCGVRFKAGA